jgi:hypothetical protein
MRIGGAMVETKVRCDRCGAVIEAGRTLLEGGGGG